jgi:hypothetical protein
MLEHVTGTASFFQAMAPVLIANVLGLQKVHPLPKQPSTTRNLKFPDSLRSKSIHGT